MTRLVHLSDFHFDGSPELRQALHALIGSAVALTPDLVVVTGDLSADGRPAELDLVAAENLRKRGAKSAFLGYHGFPATLCVSVNEEVVHGIPGNRVLN